MLHSFISVLRAKAGLTFAKVAIHATFNTKMQFQSPFGSPFNIQVFTFNSCFAIKGGRVLNKFSALFGNFLLGLRLDF